MLEKYNLRPNHCTAIVVTEAQHLSGVMEQISLIQCTTIST